MPVHNTDYDDIVFVAEDQAMTDVKEETLRTFLQTHPQGATTVAEENLYKAMVANKWQAERQARTEQKLTDMGYPPGHEVYQYYEDVWAPTPPVDNRADRPSGGDRPDAPPSATPQVVQLDPPEGVTLQPQLPKASIIPGVAEERSTRMTEGPRPADLPNELSENAFIKIDPSSFGGKKWKDRATQAGFSDKLTFQFLGSNEFSDSVTASYSTHDVLGRSESYYSFERTGNREFNLTLKFVAQGLYGDNADGIIKEVKSKVDWCRALAYPSYEGGLMYPPPVVFVGFGNMYVRSGNSLRCLVTSVSATYCTDEAPMDVETLAPYTALVDISFIGAFMVDAQSNVLDSGSILRGEY